MDLKLILESLDSDVFTEELQTKISVLVEAEIEQKVTEAVEAKEAALTEEKDLAIEEFKTSLVEKLDNYFDYLATELSEKQISESTEELAVLKKVAVLESIKSLAAEFDITIAEAKEECDEEDEDEEDEEKKDLKESLDRIVEEYSALKAKYIELAKIGLIRESAEMLTINQQEKFSKLASGTQLKSTDKADVETFITQLDAIKEALEFVGEVKVIPEVSVVESNRNYW